MESQFENEFDPNNKFHVKWLKDLVNNKEGSLVHNPFGIQVRECDTSKYLDVVMKLSRKFINESVGFYYKNLFSYEFAYQSDGEYQKCRLLKDVHGFKKGTFFEYAIVYPNSIDFYIQDDDEYPALVLDLY